MIDEPRARWKEFAWTPVRAQNPSRQKVVDDLVEGAWPGLDLICDGILRGVPFIYPAENMDTPFPGEITAGMA